MSIKICVIGASGRMGQEIIKAVEADGRMDLGGAVERADSPAIGTEISGVAVMEDLAAAAKNCDVIIDFSGPAGTTANINKYAAAGKALIVGSTGLPVAQLNQLKELGEKIPVMQDTNMSVGVNIMNKLVEMAAQAFDDSFDIEIFEAHHRYKKDAPSGTALTLGKAAAAGRGVDLNDVVIMGDRNDRVRKKGEIGFQVLRGGGIAGDHTVFYCGDNERVEITHRAFNRGIFANGAIRAACWLTDKPAGFYHMKDVLGL